MIPKQCLFNLQYVKTRTWGFHIAHVYTSGLHILPCMTDKQKVVKKIINKLELYPILTYTLPKNAATYDLRALYCRVIVQ